MSAAPHDTPAPAPSQPPAPDSYGTSSQPAFDISDVGVNLNLAGDISTAPDSSLAFTGLADLPFLQLAAGGALEADAGMESSKPSHEPAPLIGLGANLAAETSGDTTGSSTDSALLANVLGGGTTVAASVFGGEADNTQADCGSGDGLVQALLYGIAEQVDELLSC